MPAHATAMTPERDAEARRLAAEGVSLLNASRALGVNPTTLRRWALRRDVTFADGRGQAAHVDAARRNLAKAHAVGNGATRKARLAGPEAQAEFRRIRRKIRALEMRRDELMRLIETAAP